MNLLVLIHLIDGRKGKEALECATQIVTKLQNQNRRTLDLISAKCFFYYMRAHEMAGQQLGEDGQQLVASCRATLHACLRTATLRNDFEGQAVLINCLLRNYLHYNLYNQADKLVLKSTFPEQASNNEWARYYYYLGRIKALQLDYTEAHKHLLQSARKAPQNSAAGFKQHVAKVYIHKFDQNLIQLVLVSVVSYCGPVAWQHPRETNICGLRGEVEVFFYEQ